MTIFSGEGIEFLLRWFHFVAGITWIGVLYYFNLIQTPFFGTELGGQARSFVVRGLLPNALWWFRWGAMFTFATGWLIVLQRLGHGESLASVRMTLILTGGLIGTLMWANVWFVIWPAQQVVIKSAEQVASGGQALPDAAARGARAGLASRTNTLLSFTMLFFMGAASHLQQIASGSPNLVLYWLFFVVLIAAIEANALLGPGLPSQKPLATVSGTIHAALAALIVFYLNAEFVL